MRVVVALALAFSLALALSPAFAHHGDPLLSYVDAAGHFHAGLVAAGVGAPDDGEPVPPAGVGPVNLARFPFSAHPCHATLDVLLDYSPTNASIETERASVALPYSFQVELFDDETGTRLPGAVMRFDAPGTIRYVLAPEFARATPLRADLYMLTGAQADWSLRIRGWLDAEGCVVVSELEANPDGADAGHEWVELTNLGFGSVDVSGWTIRALHGSPNAMTLPAGTIIDGAGHLVVALPGQFLDNTDEVVTLEAPDGVEYARSPALLDGADDARTNQLASDMGAAWVFAEGTPGGPAEP